MTLQTHSAAEQSHQPASSEAVYLASAPQLNWLVEELEMGPLLVNVCHGVQASPIDAGCEEEGNIVCRGGHIRGQPGRHLTAHAYLNVQHTLG